MTGTVAYECNPGSDVTVAGANAKRALRVAYMVQRDVNEVNASHSESPLLVRGAAPGTDLSSKKPERSSLTHLLAN